MERKAFTLVELLVVVAIIAVLAIIIIIVLNPKELLLQAKDSARLSDMDLLSRGISLYNTDVNGSSLGNSSTVYTSIIDNAATSTAGTNCAATGLSTSSLPSGWSYHCPASSTFRNNSSGWLPINFSLISSGAPFGSLAIDPVNSTSSSDYYTYVASSTNYNEITTSLDSQKYQPTAISDGDSYPGILANGNSKGITPGARDYGLIGYWKFDEAAGTTTNNTATVIARGAMSASGVAWATGSSCMGFNCISFDSSNNGQVSLTSNPVTYDQVPITLTFWFNATQLSDCANRCQSQMILYRVSTYFFVISTSTDAVLFSANNVNNVYQTIITPAVQASAWNFVAGTIDSAGNMAIYLNGVKSANTSQLAGNALFSNSGLSFFIGNDFSNDGFYGRIDDLRIYNRALSVGEIQAIYNSPL